MTDKTESVTAVLDLEAGDTSEASEADTPTPLPRPRIRFGAIAWGLIVCAIAYAVLTTVMDADARAGFVDWLFEVEVGELVLLAVLGLGAFILLLALLGIIRGVQKAWANRRSVA